MLEIFLELPFSLVVSDEMLADELLSFTKAEVALMRRTMIVATRDGDEMDRIREAQRTSPALSLHDCAAFVLAQREEDSILLTGDGDCGPKLKGRKSSLMAFYGLLSKWRRER